MGCDIHLYVEHRVSGKWKNVAKLPPRTCSWCGGSGKDHRGEVCHPVYACGGTGKVTEPWSSRNYRAFAILADVRNGAEFVPIDMPRGIPKDASAKVMRAAKEYGMDGHSHSYTSLAELLSFDWLQVSTHHGVCHSIDYAEWVEGGRRGPPIRYSGGVGGGNVHNVSPEEMDKLIVAGDAPSKPDPGQERLHDYADWPNTGKGGKAYYTTAKWEETYAESVGERFLEFIDSLREIGDPEDVRLVYWFDN